MDTIDKVGNSNKTCNFVDFANEEWVANYFDFSINWVNFMLIG